MQASKIIIGAALASMLYASASAALEQSALPPKLKPGPASLPTIMLGEWCNDYGTTLFNEKGKPIGRSFSHSRLNEGDPLTVRRNGYGTLEQGCDFVSLERTGRVEAASTKPRREDWIPVMRGIARCIGEDGGQWSSVRFELEYYKTILTLTAWNPKREPRP
jgi:hypothetical protein